MHDNSKMIQGGSSVQIPPSPGQFASFYSNLLFFKGNMGLIADCLFQRVEFIPLRENKYIVFLGVHAASIYTP